MRTLRDSGERKRMEHNAKLIIALRLVCGGYEKPRRLRDALRKGRSLFSFVSVTSALSHSRLSGFVDPPAPKKRRLIVRRFNRRETTRGDCQRFPRSLVGVTYEVINAAVSCEPTSGTELASFLLMCPKLRFLSATYAGPLASLAGNLPLVV